jgi:DNA polymerase I
MLVGIDGTNWVHALWHAMGQHRTVGGVLDCLCSRIATVAAAAKATAVLVAFDRRSFRHGLLPQYKAQRPDHDQALDRLLERAPDAVGAAKVGQPIYEDGFEADDLLATLASVGVSRGERVALCTPDRDLWQCLAEKSVYVLRGVKTDRGEVSEADWFTEADLYRWPHNPKASKPKTAYQLRPWQWAEFQALVGESGDNVPGCPQWGEVTAAAALAKHGSIESMLKKQWKIPCTSKQLTALQNWARRDMATTLACVRLRTDCAAVWDALR